jgi:hypothetical protein
VWRFSPQRLRAPRTAETTASPSVLFSEHTLVTDADGVANVNAATVTQRRDAILPTASAHRHGESSSGHGTRHEIEIFLEFIDSALPSFGAIDP